MLLANFLHEICGGISRREWNGNHAAAGGFDFFASGDLLERPVRALHQNIRKHARNQFARSRLIKNRHVIDGSKRGQNFGAILLRHERTFGALVAANAAIAIDGHDQQIAQRARLRQAPHMARMQQIETSVGEHNYDGRRAFRARSSE